MKISNIYYKLLVVSAITIKVEPQISNATVLGILIFINNFGYSAILTSNTNTPYISSSTYKRLL